MQITIKLKGILKITIFFVVIMPAVIYTLYRAYKFVRYEAIVYLKTNSKFKYTFEAKDTSQSGYLLLTLSLPANLNYGKLVIIDAKGNLVLERQTAGVASDFRQWKIDGHTRYSYMMYDTAAYQGLAFVGSARHAVILDSALNEIKQVHLLPYGDIRTDKKQDLDHHDFIMLGDDHYFVMALYEKTVDNIPVYLPQSPKTKVAAPVIQEIKNGVVIWQWDGSRFPEFYVNSELGNKFYDTANVQDYTHINSMYFDPRDSNLIVSLHNTNQVIKVSRRTGEVMWRLGGRTSDFQLTAEQVFLRQHHATLVDSNQSLMIFDNGNKPVRSYSRVLEFKLDELNKTVTAFKSYTIPEPFAGSRGSVQKLESDYLICGGSANYILLCSSTTGEKKLEIKTNQPLYRAYLVEHIPGIYPEKSGKK